LTWGFTTVCGDTGDPLLFDLIKAGGLSRGLAEWASSIDSVSETRWRAGGRRFVRGGARGGVAGE